MLQHVSTDVALRQFMRMKKKDAAVGGPALLLLSMRRAIHSHRWLF